MANRPALLLLCVLLAASLAAERIDFSIRYMGIKVACVTMDDSLSAGGGRLRVSARSTSFASHLVQMDNVFTSRYRGDYLPDEYCKLVEQKDYTEDRVSCYNRQTGQAFRSSRIDRGRNLVYPITPTTRDFFSALYHIRRQSADEGEVELDAAGTLWVGHYRLLEVERLKTSIGKVMARKVEITFTPMNDTPRQRSDMLTNNLVSRGAPLIFWFTDDDRRLPVRASFRMSPFAVNWVIEGVSP